MIVVNFVFIIMWALIVEYLRSYHFTVNKIFKFNLNLPFTDSKNTDIKDQKQDQPQKKETQQDMQPNDT